MPAGCSASKALATETEFTLTKLSDSGSTSHLKEMAREQENVFIDIS